MNGIGERAGNASMEEVSVLEHFVVSSWRVLSFDFEIMLPESILNWEMQVVMAIKCRGDHILGGLHTSIDTRHITMTSKMVLSLL